MSNQILQNDYAAVMSTNSFYTRNRDRWQFLMESYVGGDEYRSGNYLTRYQLETAGEYQARLANTPLDNHCQSVIQTYISFLFRKHPDREMDTWTGPGHEDVAQFLADCDREGRDLNSFMKQVSIWSSVFGHAWIIMTKPNLGLVTQAQEAELGVRPYVNLLTPLVVSDWKWERSANGEYNISYFKYVEEVVSNITVVKEWTPETITTWVLDDDLKEGRIESVEINMLGRIPVVLVYNQRSITRDAGISDINDIADIQRQIYNLTSENEQAIRLNGHPSLVVPPTAQLGSGAGAIIQLQDGSDPGLNPYYLESGSSNIASIHASMDKLIAAIDRISFTGGVRATVTKTQSGVAMETEFQLLNAKLSEKADQLELAEEQLWRLFAIYQNKTWSGEIKYADSFNIRDDQREYAQLGQAKSAATDPRVFALIDREIVELLGENPDLIVPTSVTLPDGSVVPLESAEPFDEPEEMYNPATGESGWVIDFESKREAMLNGWVEKED